ncbi:hypothetical protein C8Q78DRAFT_224808 [Trametes maxima]|nr:hypothetical protein C8Q78DRAFT_224808 [Trametes maxima]
MFPPPIQPPLGSQQLVPDAPRPERERIDHSPPPDGSLHRARCTPGPLHATDSDAACSLKYAYLTAPPTGQPRPSDVPEFSQSR